MIFIKALRIGIFGLSRGSSLIDSILMCDGELTAVCDRNEKLFDCIPDSVAKDITFYTDFDKFIEHEMDAVILCNCFHQHAAYAIRALNKGIHVLSECLSNTTMAEGVALIRAAKASTAFYMLLENYPFMRFCQEMKRVYEGGSLGNFLYGEGEYNHPFNLDNADEHAKLRPYPDHWRNYLPRAYYITHSLAPLMYISGAKPVRVSAMPVNLPFDEYAAVGSPVSDRAAIITCLNDDGSVYRVTGCASFGAHSNYYRICGTRGMIENPRGKGGSVMLRYNSWQIPEGMQRLNEYTPEFPASVRALAEKADHGGGDFFAVVEFFNCIRENRRPVFDEYFATRCASVGILSHRSLLEFGVPYDIPDFTREEDMKKYENDTLTPFFSGENKPTMPCNSDPDYKPTEKQMENYLEMLK